MKASTIFILLPFLALNFFIGNSGSQKSYTNNKNNSKKSITDEKVEKLLNEMTLEEKIDLLGGTGFATKQIKRLGIPELKMTDGPLGVRWGESSAFPAGISMASTWDTALINKLGTAIGEEVKGKGRDVILGPCVNIARIPQGGRNFESFGEDPYLASRMAVSYIKGVQSEDVAATVKHFAANNQEYQRGFVNVKIGERPLNEIYLPAFKAAVEEGKSLCIMSAYNKINGEYCSENDYLLKTKLKNEWGFQGLVMSDWGAVHSSIPTAKGGLDLEMPTGQYLNDSTLLNAVKNGTIKESTINDKVRRILTVINKLGLFEKTHEKNSKLVNTKEHQEVALQVAREGIVLLKNENNILPINTKKIKSIAVIGPNAAVARTGGGGSSQVNPIFSISPLAVLKHKLGKDVKINYAEGTKLLGETTALPASFFYLPGSDKHGARGEYFANKELKGKPAFTRIDSSINFNWGSGSPKAGFNSDNFSVRWTFDLKPEKTGNYIMDVLSDDGVRLYLNNKLVISDWTNHSTKTNSYKTFFEAGKRYSVKLEYYENLGGADVKFAWHSPDDVLINSAIDAAKKSDIAIIFAGTSNAYESEGFDRDSLSLPGNQNNLINSVSKANKNTVVVITSGSPVTMSSWIKNVKGIMESWFAGEEIGNAVADILLGNVNPSGKLPVTFPKSWKDCSAYGLYKTQDSVTNYSDGIFVGYRHFDKDNIEPLYPFGFGLSYTSFEFSNLKLRKSPDKDYEWKLNFELKNTGSRDGSEVAQLYIKDFKSSLPRPDKELKKFKRVSLKPGETKEIEFTINKNDLSFYDPAKHGWITEPGEFQVMIGSSSRDIKLKDNFELKD
jgi:beta-glucosidase